jgi:hypothetical protein
MKHDTNTHPRRNKNERFLAGAWADLRAKSHQLLSPHPPKAVTNVSLFRCGRGNRSDDQAIFHIPYGDDDGFQVRHAYEVPGPRVMIALHSNL